MSDQWYYRVFGEEFGPMPFAELKELTEFGMVTGTDEVRSAESSNWVTAASVGELGLADSEVTTAVATAASGGLDFEPPAKRGTDDWFCRLGDQELGPLSFEELTQYAENEQLGVDDEVKLGEQGKWRRVGSIGRLMAVIPYQAVEKNIVQTAPKSKTPVVELPVVDPAPPTSRSATPITSAAELTVIYQAAFEEARTRISESLMEHAEKAFKQVDDQARSQIAWASAAGADRQWWGWAGGVEFGPVEFPQVFGLARNGQLKPNDLVRNGLHGQYGPSSNVPGLFNAVAMLARATEVMALAKSQAQHAVTQTRPSTTLPESILKYQSQAAQAPVAPPPPAGKPRDSDPEFSVASPRGRSISDSGSHSDLESSRRVESVADSRPAARVPEPVAPPTAPMSNPVASPNRSSSGSTSVPAYRPPAPARKPDSKPSRGPSSPWLADTLASLKEPKAIGSIAAIAVVLLIVGWGFLPKSKAADIQKYQALKQILKEIQSNRENPSAIAAMKTKALATGKEIADALKATANGQERAKQSLLWAARDELPRYFNGGPGAEAAEKNLALRLQEAGVVLGLESPTAVASAIKSAPLPDD